MTPDAEATTANATDELAADVLGQCVQIRSGCSALRGITHRGRVWIGAMVRYGSMQVAPRPVDFEEDQRVILHGMSWQDFEALLAIRGDRAGVRMYFLDGEIELMSPAKIHEGRKTTLARLLEVRSLEVGIDLNGFGAWTLKKEMRDVGAEPDECYIVGTADKDVPDLVIEVEWSRATGLAKHEIYRRLGVRELWTLKSSGDLEIRALQKGAWVDHEKSKLLPKLDARWLLSFLSIEPQSKAVRSLRDALRAPKRRH